jgi:hypothetical protein
VPPQCEFAECGREAFRDGLCFGHFKQRQRSQELRPLRGYRSERETLLRNAFALADLDENLEADYDFERAIQRFFKSVLRYQFHRYRRRGG